MMTCRCSFAMRRVSSMPMPWGGQSSNREPGTRAAGGGANGCAGFVGGAFVQVVIGPLDLANARGRFACGGCRAGGCTGWLGARGATSGWTARLGRGSPWLGFAPGGSASGVIASGVRTGGLGARRFGRRGLGSTGTGLLGRDRGGSQERQSPATGHCHQRNATQIFHDGRISFLEPRSKTVREPNTRWRIAARPFSVRHPLIRGEIGPQALAGPTHFAQSYTARAFGSPRVVPRGTETNTIPTARVTPDECCPTLHKPHSTRHPTWRPSFSGWRASRGCGRGRSAGLLPGGGAGWEPGRSHRCGPVLPPVRGGWR